MRVTAEFEIVDPQPVCREDWDDIYTAIEAVCPQAGLSLTGVVFDGPDE